MIPVEDVKTYTPELLQGDIMVVSNEDGPLHRGRIVGFVELTQSKQLTPMVENKDGKRYICLGVILPYDEQLKTLLETLSGRVRFKLLGNIFWLREDLRRIERGQTCT